MQYLSLSGAYDFCSSIERDVFFPKKSFFNDGEIFLDLDGFGATNDVVLVQSLFKSHDSLLEMLFAKDIISRNFSSRVHLLLSYLSYSRQDREMSPTLPMSSKVIANIISNAGFATVSAVHLHSPQIQCFFNVPCFNILINDDLVSHIRSCFVLEDLVISSTDIGGAKVARTIANGLKCNVAIIEKIRDLNRNATALCVVGDVYGKSCILVDDIIDSGDTLCKAATLLKFHGAKSIYAYATHGIFSDNAIIKIENSDITKVVVSNTIAGSRSNKVEYLNISNSVVSSVEKRLTGFI